MFQSRQLAEKIESRLNNSVKSLPSRGVKRAGFKVLHSMAMPSILVEFGYTSNIEDSKILKNYTYRTRLAQGIYLGVRDFLSGNIEQGVDQTYLAYIQKQENLNKSREKKKALAKEKLKRAQKRAKKYKIKKGDYLSKIAKNHKVTISSICYLNGISIKSTLIAGRTLLIPRR
jgi:N-acetylmuramoyl-L-alanine amidase